MNNQISFSDILANIARALEMGNYSDKQQMEWGVEYQNAQVEAGNKRPDYVQSGYVNNLYELTGFLVGWVGINNGTEYKIILDATQLALNEKIQKI